MRPTMKTTEKERAEETRLREQFIRQVEDHSLPAQEVLTDQRECRASGEAPVLFVP